MRQKSKDFDMVGSLEYPEGVFTPLTVAGSPTLHFAEGVAPRFDWFEVTIPFGETFVVRLDPA